MADTDDNDGAAEGTLEAFPGFTIGRRAPNADGESPASETQTSPGDDDDVAETGNTAKEHSRRRRIRAPMATTEGGNSPTAVAEATRGTTTATNATVEK